MKLRGSGPADIESLTVQISEFSKEKCKHPIPVIVQITIFEHLHISLLDLIKVPGKDILLSVLK